jgi:hypothetical protein
MSLLWGEFYMMQKVFECREVVKMSGKVRWDGNEKGRLLPAFFIVQSVWSGRGDSGNRAGIHTCAAIDASFGVNSPLLSYFAYGVGRAGIITCAAIDTFVGNYMSQDITSFRIFLSGN